MGVALTAEDLLKLAMMMREAQKAHFRSRMPYLLQRSMDLERQFDQLVRTFFDSRPRGSDDSELGV
jgi:hypothetical protein